MSGASATPVKRALLIGIDAYPHLTQLEGCVNDVQLMQSTLVDQFGFPPRNVTVLTDAQATRSKILDALDALVAATAEGDIVVVHYAGHGSQMTDREGDEPDGLDETIMPFDSEGRWGVNRDITDDEIHLRLERLGAKTSNITLVFDCCHSGTITRDTFGVRSRSMEPDLRPAAELPPSPVPEAAWRNRREQGPSGWMPLADQYVLIAGCRDEETSFEYRPPEGNGKLVHGALTYFLCHELRSAELDSGYRELFERVAAKVTAANSRQHPQMEGQADREIFGTAVLASDTWVRVTERTGDTVILGRGAAQGMTVGSIWSVHPAGAGGWEGDPLGRVEVTTVRAVTAEARILDERSAGAIVPDARAAETIHAYGDLRLAVEVVGPVEHEAVKELRRRIADSPLLGIAGESAAASARVYVLPPRPAAGPHDPVPQLGRLEASVLAVVAEDGRLAMPPKPITACDQVVSNLERLARYRHALAIENPDPASAMRGAFDLDLLRRTPDGKWRVAEPEAAGGQIVFEEGEVIAFRITSHFGAPVYVNLLDFGLTGSVSLVYPARGAKEKLGPRMNFEIGTRPGERGFTLRMPREFPYNADAAGEVAGTETLKLFVSQVEADFSFLSQEGIRKAGRPGSPLAALWQAATAGVRDLELTMPVGEEDWTTVVKSFVLRRRSAAPLDPDGRPVSVGEATLLTPGLMGEATPHPWRSSRAEASSLSTSVLAGTLRDAGVDVRQTIEIGAASARGVARDGDGGRPEIELRVRDPGPEYGQMVMASDELGTITWHFAPAAEPRPAVRGGRAVAPATRVYRVPGTVPTEQAPPGGRGLMGVVGRKFLNVLVFPLVEPKIGAVSEGYATRWEAEHRPYRVRCFGPEDYAGEAGPEITGDDWPRLSSGRALLMVHGTFSRAHGAFGNLPRDFVEALHRRYEGRVFAFDHFTLSHDPRRNVAWLLERMPDGTTLDLDIICHSRGGLVSRLLAEKQGELALGSRRVRVGKIVFVGTPNAGTILADASHMGDLIDSYTNLLNFLPDNGILDILSGVVTVAKMLAVGAVKGLPGLQSMHPAGEFSKWLNEGPQGDTRYFAVSSDFTPVEPGLRQFAVDRLMDRVFKAANDLVVPTEGVFAANGSRCFPIDDRVVLSGADAVAHTTFFGSRAAQAKMLEWLAS